MLTPGPGLPGANTKFWGQVSWENYSRAIHLALTGAGAFTDGKNLPVKIDFTSKRLIGIGHSMGGVSLCVRSREPQPKSLAERVSRVLAHTLYPAVKFDSLVLVEPMLITIRHMKASGRKLAMDEGALARRDFWESREEAWTSLSTKGMKEWDKRTVEFFVVSRTVSNSQLFSFCIPDHLDVPAGIWPPGDNQG